MDKSSRLRTLLLLPEGWTDDDWGRFWMHSPHGIFAGWVLFGFPLPFLAPFIPSLGWIIASLGTLFFMCVYQAFQDWRIGDKSYKDVYPIVLWWCMTVGILGILWRLL